MSTESCQIGYRLRDAYLIALSREDSVRKALQSGEVTFRELIDAREAAKDARCEYWEHVEHHQCRER